MGIETMDWKFNFKNGSKVMASSLAEHTVFWVTNLPQVNFWRALPLFKSETIALPIYIKEIAQYFRKPWHNEQDLFVDHGKHLQERSISCLMFILTEI